MFTYFYVFNDYGMKPSAILFIIMEPGYYPKDEDVYDANEPNFGNTNYGVEDKRDTLYWDTSSAAYMDVRLFYVFRNAGKWSKCRWNPDDEDIPKFWRHSKVSGGQICYTTEALHYAQGAYLITIVSSQWANNILCKTRTLSLSQH